MGTVTKIKMGIMLIIIIEIILIFNMLTYQLIIRSQSYSPTTILHASPNITPIPEPQHLVDPLRTVISTFQQVNISMRTEPMGPKIPGGMGKNK